MALSVNIDDLLLSKSPIQPPDVLIPMLGPYMAGSDADKALRILSESVTQYRHNISPVIIDNLVVFVGAVLRPGLYVLPGLSSLLESLCLITKIAHLPTGLNILSLQSSEKCSLLTALSSALPDPLPISLLSAILSFVEGETDPQPLLSGLQLIRSGLANIHEPLSSDAAESVVDQCCIYFPITYDGPNGDVLRTTLLDCLTANISMAPFSVPFFLDKLHSPLTQAQNQSLVALSQCMRCFRLGTFDVHLPEISSCLVQIWNDPASSPAVLQSSISALTASVLALYPKLYNPAEGEDPYHHRFLKYIIQSISDVFESSGRSRRAPIYTSALSALCSTPLSYRIAYRALWPLLKNHICSVNEDHDRIAFISIVDSTFVSGVVNGVVSSSDDVEDIVATFVSCSDPSLSTKVVSSSLSVLIRMIPFISSRSHIDQITQLALSIINAPTGDDLPRAAAGSPSPASLSSIAVSALVALSSLDPQGIVSATYPWIIRHHHHFQSLCVESSAYLSSILPDLSTRIFDNDYPLLSATLTSIFNQCPSEIIPDAIRLIAPKLTTPENVHLFQAMYRRASPEDQVLLSADHLSSQDYLCNIYSISCILSRNRSTPLHNQDRILHDVYDHAIGNESSNSAKIVADILNKANDQNLSSFVSSSLYSNLDLSSPNHSLLCLWICQALSCRGDNNGFIMARGLCRFSCHHPNLHILLDLDPDHHIGWRIVPLYQQRMSHTILSEMSVVSDYGLTLYDCLPSLLTKAPAQVIIDFADTLLPILIKSLSSSSSSSSALSSLYIMIVSNPSSISPYLSEIIPSMIALTSPSYPSPTRFQALQSLSIIIHHVPHSSIFPYRPSISISLTRALDDPKRVCRNQARQCIMALS